jgi:hypothetical protein
MRLIFSSIFIIMIALLTTACSKRVYSDRASGVDFSAYKTYAWLPNGKDTTQANVYDNEITYQHIRQAVDNEMSKRGYTVDATNPDLVMLIHLNFENKQQLVSNPLLGSYGYYYPGYSYGPWYPSYYYGYYNMPYIYGAGISSIQYTQGTLVIDLIDRKKNSLIWRGWTDEIIYDNDDVKDLFGKVDNIFKKYPVKANKK